MAESQAPARPSGNANGNRQPLAQAPAAEGPPPTAAPLNYRAEFLIETAEGYHVLISGEQLTPKDCMVWVKQASGQLKAQGFKPVRRDLVVNVPAAAAAAPQANRQGGGGGGGQTPQGQPQGDTGEAYAIAGANGRPPECSAHGPMKFVKGTYKQDHPRAGQTFEFWGCNNRNCKVSANPDGSLRK